MITMADNENKNTSDAPAKDQQQQQQQDTGAAGYAKGATTLLGTTPCLLHKYGLS